MTTIEVDEETARALQARARAQNMTLDSYLKSLVDTSDTPNTRSKPARTPEQWIAEFNAWASSHKHLSYEADDSRDSIYEGRGE